MADPPAANNDVPTKQTETDAVIARVNRISVSAALLAEVMHLQAAELPGGRPVPEAQMLRLFQLLIAKGVPPGRLGEFATAIDFRLIALARLEQESAVGGWLRPGGWSTTMSISPEMLKVAATEPLTEDSEGQPVFDEPAFRRRLMAAVETGGSA